MYSEFLSITLQIGEPYVNHLGYNGDYIPFAYQAGISSMDIKFSNMDTNISRIYPARGTGYDTLTYYKKIDPDFRFLETCSQVLVYIIRQLSDSLLLPFDVMEYSNVLKEALDNIKEYSETRVEQLPASSNSKDFKDYLRENDVSLDILNGAINGFKAASVKWNQTLEKADRTNPILIRMLNDQMMQLEKAFLNPAGLPLQRTTNHVIFSTKHLGGGRRYGKAIFPGIVNLLEEFNHLPTEDERNKWTGWEDLRRHVTEIYVCILQASSLLKPHHDI